MKFLLAAINAKYIHSNPAIYSLSAYARLHNPGVEVEIGEYTINHQMEEILQDLYLRKPDFLGFSCYIWNISYVLELVHDIHKVLPDTHIWLGGPEVSYDARKVLSKEPEIMGIMRGEGERTFTEVTKAYLEPGFYECPERYLKEVRGITMRTEAGILETLPQPLLSMDEIPFYYEDMGEFENRIVYYESSRGCPFSCSYCLSSIDKSVRFRSLSLVTKELQFFLDKKVPQVKFVDRTFNCKKSHTMGIWRYLLEHDNGITNFHFEITADMLDDEEIELIRHMRPGLIQLEIGVQSTNPDTVSEIHRRMDLVKLEENVAKVHAFHNTHQHLDLIAGLPYENFDRFLLSFNDVYRMHPDQLQLGFLKVLKGSFMADSTENYHLRFRDCPPYEVLCTDWLSYGDVIRLKKMEDMVEVYYNSGQFPTTMEKLTKETGDAAACYLALADYYENNGLFGMNHNRLARYEFLYDFLKTTGNRSEEELASYRDSLMYDLYLRENVKSRPSFAPDFSYGKSEIRDFFHQEEEKPCWLQDYEGYDARQMMKMAHMEAMSDGSFILFDYKNRDPLSNNAKSVRFTLRGEENGTERDEKGKRSESNRDPRTSGQRIWDRVPLLSEL